MMSVALLAAVLAQAPADVEARIERVVNGLLPETAFRRRWGAPAKLRDRMAQLHTPGISIAVVNGGRIEWARGFGVLEAGRTDPVSERTLFQAGSISKPVFALGVLRLVQEGKLDLDADVNDTLRTWKVPANGSWQPRVTLRQILTHSAGFTVHGFPGYRTTEPIPSVAAVLDGLPPANTDPVRVNILPGTEWRYSGGGITVGQLAVTDLLGEPFPALMQKLVLGPLGMADSTYEQPLPPARAAAAATAHPWKGDPLPGHWHVYPEMAAAGLWTTAADLARAGIEVQKAVRGESAFLTKERAVQMLSRTIQDDMGIGFFLEGKGENQRFGHGGWDEGFVARATFYKERGLGAVAMINSNEGAPLLDEVLRAIAKEYGWPGYFDEEEKAFAASPETLDAYAGEYTAAGGFRATVTRREGGLLFAADAQPPVELWPSSADRFFARAVDADVAFEKGDHGLKLRLQQDGRETVAEKVARDAASVEQAPGEDGAKAALDRSPRHGEWAQVPGPGGQPLRTWVVYPERKDKAPVVVVIHEIFGLSDWIRAVADRLAAEGFIAVAPDLVSGKGEGGGGTEAAKSRDDVVKLIRSLAPEEADGRIDAVRAWALSLPSANGRSATVGFCWGGTRSFAYAAREPGLGAAVVYYGTSPSDPAALARVKAPVLGLYGGDDARVDATIGPAEAELKRLGRTYEVAVYEGAGHGFLRAQDGRDGANLRAAEAAWPRTIAFLKRHLGEGPR